MSSPCSFAQMVSTCYDSGKNHFIWPVKDPKELDTMKSTPHVKDVKKGGFRDVFLVVLERKQTPCYAPKLKTRTISHQKGDGSTALSYMVPTNSPEG